MLNGAVARDAVVVVVPQGVVVETPIHVLYLSTGKFDSVSKGDLCVGMFCMIQPEDVSFSMSMSVLLPPAFLTFLSLWSASSDISTRDASAPRLLLHAAEDSAVEV